MAEKELQSDMFPGYVVFEKLGAGGGGTVYKAYHKNLKKDVVIKRIHDFIKDEEKQRIEVDILKNLHHQYLPQVFDYFVQDGVAYTVMDFIEGESFGDLLRNKKRFSEKQVIKYATQIAEAVAYLHSQRIPIIHGDIKPDNIMLTSEDNICLIDFNISDLSSSDGAYTEGYTPGYSAPEQYEQYVSIKNRLDKAVKTQSKPVSDDKTELLNDKTELLDDKTELLDDETELLDDKTELLDDKTELINDKTELLDDNTELLDNATSKANDDTELIENVEVTFNNNSEGRDTDKGITNKILITKQSDIYSIGATLFHMLTGKKYVAGMSRTTLPSSTSDGLVYILNKCLSVNPSGRFKDGKDLLNAFLNIHKYDKDYKRKRLKKTAVSIAVVLLIVGIFLGYFVIKENQRRAKLNRYQECIELLKESSDKDEFETIYAEAVNLYPNNIDSYYQKALFLYNSGLYQECIEYIQKDVETNTSLYEYDEIGDIYYIQGEAYFELSIYDKADSSFRTSISYNNTNPNFFVDDAIALARMQKIDAAKEQLAAAENLNISTDRAYLTKAEIELAGADTDKAKENFEKCIETTEDDYTLLRAYVGYSHIYDGQNVDKDTINSLLKTLDEGILALPLERKELLFERKAQIAIDAATLYTDSGYEEVAIEALTEIDKYGWATFSTYNNLVILYERIDEFDKALEFLNKMENQLPDNYKVYTRYAFLEVDIQGAKDEKDRDYNTFKSYYEKALELSSDQDKQTDMELKKLQDVYQQLVDNNWL